MIRMTQTAHAASCIQTHAFAQQLLFSLPELVLSRNSQGQAQVPTQATCAVCYVTRQDLMVSSSCYLSHFCYIGLPCADCEKYWVQTMTGPGGMAGPLRIDLEGKFTHSANAVLREYSPAEAEAAFHRTAANHRKTGWGIPGQ